MALERFTSRRKDSSSSKKRMTRTKSYNRHIYGVLVRRKVAARVATQAAANAFIDGKGFSNFACTQLTFPLKDKG